MGIERRLTYRCKLNPTDPKAQLLVRVSVQYWVLSLHPFERGFMHVGTFRSSLLILSSGEIRPKGKERATACPPLSHFTE